MSEEQKPTPVLRLKPRATPASYAPPESAPPAPPPAPTTFTVGVSDVTFNATNAVFGRLLRTKDNHVVTLEYWKQLSPMADDATPYFTRKK